jgi:PKD repeat protein
MVCARYLHRRLLPLLASAVLLVCVSGAQAETYGELGHFGSAGVGRGQFKFTAGATFGTHAFGVDPTDNSVYVGDEPQKREYRIQKLSAAGQFIAATPLLKPPNRDGIEGIAVDPVKKRIYMLALERRSESATIDPSEPAAGTLYAFSTEPSGEALQPAAGTNEGVLAGPSELEAQSDAPEGALLSPKGITVDPVTHDVIILGEVEQTAPKGVEEPQLRFALQRVHADGTRGERYIDGTDFFAGERTPNSPAVSPEGAVYVAITQAQVDSLLGPVDQLAQIPSDFSSTAPPTVGVQFATLGSFPGEVSPVVEFNSTEPASKGGGLSIVPEGATGGAGTIYTRAHVFLRNGQGGATYPGVLAFDGADGSEIGWTGGQKPGGAGCAIGFAGSVYSALAAGRERTVFVLDSSAAHVVEFGPGGTGCPTAEASTPTAEVNGEPLSPSEALPPGTEVTFSSALTQANAVSVEWNFGDGQTETDSADEYQHTEAKHKFVRGGELTVSEMIHTDDLATPTIVKETKISVSSVALPPTAVLEGPVELTLGASQPPRLVYLEGGGLDLEGGGASPGAVAVASASFDGSASFDPNPPGSNQIKSYHWTFGDGRSETTETPTVAHAYEQAGVYKVELTVTDALGLTSESSTLTVKVNVPPPPPTEAVHQAMTPAPSAPAIEPPKPPASIHPLIPVANLAGTSLVASPSGRVRLVVTCPVAETSCAGAVTLRTLHAVVVQASGSRAHRKTHRAAVVTLAGGTFTVAGGRQSSLTLRLTARGRALLARMRHVPARTTLVAHDLAGTTHTTELTVALRIAGSRVKK